ncbi:MAG: TetR family transcriptional regulator [Ponticaulis sp.]|nr:TetR family transcriptional regulator [Ponticaulis sp.]
MTKNSYHHGDLADALLIAAEDELIEKGVEGISLRSVAKRAGVSHGAPAHHFGNARGLLTALAGKGYERLRAMQSREEAAAASEPRAKLIANGLGYIKFAMENRELFRLMFNSSVPDRHNEAFAAVSYAVFDKLISQTEAHTGHSPLRHEASMTELMASWSIVHGLAELIVSGRAELPLSLKDKSPETRDALIKAIIGQVNLSVDRS